MFRAVLKGAARGKFHNRQGKRGALSPKRGNNQFYKGTGSRKEGNHTDHGHYVIRDEKVMEIKAPDLTGFQLKPYVALTTPKQS